MRQTMAAEVRLAEANATSLRAEKRAVRQFILAPYRGDCDPILLRERPMRGKIPLYGSGIRRRSVNMLCLFLGSRILPGLGVHR
jgi:hypothetical protein